MVGIGRGELLSEMFENETEEGNQVTHQGHLILHWYVLRREIGRVMPPVGIRCVVSVWGIKPVE
jgi:hypothetical protein